MTRKGFFKWLWEDVILIFAGAVGFDVIVKTQWPKLLSNFAEMLGTTMKKSVDNDKRAEMLREFRRMETAGINIDNLKRRHADSVRNQPMPEYLFVELLCKIPPEDPNNPSSIRPPVAPAANGAVQPQNDRQADLRWLNDMPDDQFYQMLEFIHHNVISQWWRIGWNRIALALAATLAGLGVAGIWALGILKILWHVIMRLSRWASGSLFRIALVVLIAAIIFWPLALIVMIILRAFQDLRGASSSQNAAQQRHGLGFFSFIGAMIGVPILIWIYFRLVPTETEKNLIPVLLMALVAVFCFWSTRWLRNALFFLIMVITLIFLRGDIATAVAGMKTTLTGVTIGKSDTGTTIGSRQQLINREAAASRKTKETPVQPAAVSTPPPAAPETEALPITVPTSQRVAEQVCPKLPQPIEYGDFVFVLTHCVVRGNQVRLSGNIQYDGSEKTNMYFHPFKAYDDAGDIYIVQDGRFGSSDNFGLGHSGQWMYPHTSVPFSFELGPKDGSIPRAAAVTLVMPCSDQLGGQIVLQLTLK